jgi:alkanesulfonate monooxygenase SsuD/methylene tetrahydromethanopterin reductase-like flavin-dependent oxidoreductase (luciferase family)
MKLGFFTMPIHPLGRDWRTTLREDREAFFLADELGFSEAYVGEHVTDLAENITSCTIFLASLVDRIKTMRLGTGTVNLPNSHPASVAAQIAMLDHMLDGRLNFGISPGGLLSDAEIFGNLEADRNAMFVEGIETILKLWATDPPYDINGKYWKLTTAKTLLKEIGQGIIAKPLQKPHPPIVVTAVAPYSKGVAAAAARGWDPISANFLMPKWVATHRDSYVEGCNAGGRPVDLANWRVAKSIFVAEDSAAARAYARGPKSPYVHYYNSLFTKLVRNGRSNLFKEDPDLPDAELTLDHVLDRCVICGSPSEVVERLIAFREEVGPFGTMLYAGHDWADPGLAKTSMRLMAEKVAPRIV